jgi:hypothetical protein
LLARAKIADTELLDLGFLPENLVVRCRELIVKYHVLHGYRCLPNILWQAGLGPVIQQNEAFSKLLDKASKTRSSKKANENFVAIATALLALEILANRLAGWGSLFPSAAEKARNFLSQNAAGTYTPLTNYYVYPPKFIGFNAIAALSSVK